MIKYLVFISLVILTMGCTDKTENKKPIDWQGHRGARGNFPENTWPAFEYALQAGMTTLELDVVISKDKKVVVSHEPYLNHQICLDTAGNSIEKSSEKSWNLYEMTYEQIEKCDCGSLGHPNFEEQKQVAVHKPLLSDIIIKIKSYAESKESPLPGLNVEIKYVAEMEGVYTPGIAEFSELVYEVLVSNYPNELLNIQSFNFDVLKHWHKQYPSIALAALVESNTEIQNQFEYLGFRPEIYSPYYLLIDKALVDTLHHKNVKIIPWTVNDEKIAGRLIEMGVDGIITDYPAISENFNQNE